MKSTFLTSISPILLFAVGMAVASGAPEGKLNAPPPGFQALFNGENLEGWYGWGARDPNDLWKMTAAEQANDKRTSVEGGAAGGGHIKAHWRVENGELVNAGHSDPVAFRSFKVKRL